MFAVERSSRCCLCKSQFSKTELPLLFKVATGSSATFFGSYGGTGATGDGDRAILELYGGGFPFSWQANEAKLAEDRHRQAIQIAIDSNKGNIWSNVGAAIIGLIGVAIGVLATGIFQKAPVINVNVPSSFQTQDATQK
jgi:hypothetical protein